MKELFGSRFAVGPTHPFLDLDRYVISSILYFSKVSFLTFSSEVLPLAHSMFHHENQRTGFEFTALWHEDCWNILPHVLHDGLLHPAVGALTVTVTEEKESNNRKPSDFFQGIPMQNSHPYNLSAFAVIPKRHLGVPAWSQLCDFRPRPTSRGIMSPFGLLLPSASPAASCCIGAPNADTENYWNTAVPSFSSCPKIAVGSLWLLVLDIQIFPFILFFLSKWHLVGLAVWTKRHSKLQFI